MLLLMLMCDLKSEAKRAYLSQMRSWSCLPDSGAEVNVAGAKGANGNGVDWVGATNTTAADGGRFDRCVVRGR